MTCAVIILIATTIRNAYLEERASGEGILAVARVEGADFTPSAPRRKNMEVKPVPYQLSFSPNRTLAGRSPSVEIGKIESRPGERIGFSGAKAREEGFLRRETTSSTPKIGNRGFILASWYGNYFHGRETASGEIFNMYLITAAHRTWPFGIRVRVINPKNGWSVVVVVTDRGPYKYGRDLDLSYEAARLLGFVDQGVGWLEYEIISTPRS